MEKGNIDKDQKKREKEEALESQIQQEFEQKKNKATSARYLFPYVKACIVTLWVS